jgi:tRNA/tmRNA/rRNA uracil-C5-methylase (TrmA/RlmC/RlmD family)
VATLLDGVTANGAGTGAEHTAPASVLVTGTFDGATVVVQVSSDDSVYVKSDNVSIPNPCTFRAPGVCNIDCKGTYYIRCVVSGVGSATDLDAVSTV